MTATIQPYDWRTLLSVLFTVAVVICGPPGCHSLSPGPPPLETAQPSSRADETASGDASDQQQTQATNSAGDVQLAGYTAPQHASQHAPQTAPHDAPPPRIADFFTLRVWPLSLDTAVQIALQNSTVLRSYGSSVLALPASTRTTFDPAIAATNPGASRQAALSAYDPQFESSLLYNGGGNALGAPAQLGQFGVFSQPETMATAGVGKFLKSGTKVSAGAFGGYDEEIAGGPYAALGAELRHPLLRGSGSEINAITGPQPSPGQYRGVLLAQLGEQSAQLELERGVRDLVREVASGYWELHYAYQHLDAKRRAFNQAERIWRQQRQRTQQAAAPADQEAVAYQQFLNAKAEVDNAIAGARPGQPGVYPAELKLRLLLGLPESDGQLLRPNATPITVETFFDWQQALTLAHARRLELRGYEAGVKRRRLEIKAASNTALPQLDVVARYRRLADDGSQQSATFSEALDGWQVGVVYSQALGGRREQAAVRNANLQLSRQQALLREQYRQVTADLRRAFIELDRAFEVMRSMAAGRQAAQSRAAAETERYAAGGTQLVQLGQAQNSAAQADVAWRRAVVDYNLAFLQIHTARGTLLDAVGVGFSGEQEDQRRYAQQTPSVYAAPLRHARNLPAAVSTGQPMRR